MISRRLLVPEEMALYPVSSDRLQDGSEAVYNRSRQTQRQFIDEEYLGLSNERLRNGDLCFCPTDRLGGEGGKMGYQLGNSAMLRWMSDLTSRAGCCRADTPRSREPPAGDAMPFRNDGQPACGYLICRLRWPRAGRPLRPLQRGPRSQGVHASPRRRRLEWRSYLLRRPKAQRRRKDCHPPTYCGAGG